MFAMMNMAGMDWPIVTIIYCYCQGMLHYWLPINSTTIVDGYFAAVATQHSHSFSNRFCRVRDQTRELDGAGLIGRCTPEQGGCFWLTAVAILCCRYLQYLNKTTSS